MLSVANVFVSKRVFINKKKHEELVFLQVAVNQN